MGLFGIVVNFIITTIIIVIAYNALKTPLVLLIWLFVLLSAIRVIRNKVIIDSGILRFDRLISSKEISLEEVSQIVVDESMTNTADDDQEITYVYVSDKMGRTVFKFPFSYVNKLEDKQRFKDAVLAINPAIEVNLETNIIVLNRLIKDVKEYRKSKKKLIKMLV